MTTEEFYQFGVKKPHYRYLPDILGEKPLRCKIPQVGKLMHVLNAHSTKTITFMPKAREELPNENLEAIYCNHCHSYLPIRRVHASITKSPALSPKTSTYIPQPMAYCKCKLSAILVDHRGLLRVYGNSMALVNYLTNFPIHHQLSLGTHLEVPITLLDGKKPRYERIVTPRYLWQTSLIDLSNLTIDHASVVLPVPSLKLKYYHQNYAYNHKVFILTTKYLVLPSGHAIPIKDPYLHSLLEEAIPRPNYLPNTPNMRIGTILRSIKRTQEHLLATNKIMVELNNKLIDHYKLPNTQPRLYAFQTIGYLQLVSSNIPTPHRHGNKTYILPEDSNDLTRTRTISRRILRNILNSMSVQTLLKSTTIRSFAKIPPPTIYMPLILPPPTYIPTLCNSKGIIA